jgi:hypothetical protein
VRARGAENYRRAEQRKGDECCKKIYRRPERCGNWRRDARISGHEARSGEIFFVSLLLLTSRSSLSRLRFASPLRAMSRARELSNSSWASASSHDSPYGQVSPQNRAGPIFLKLRAKLPLFRCSPPTTAASTTAPRQRCVLLGSSRLQLMPTHPPALLRFWIREVRWQLGFWLALPGGRRA